MALRLQIVSRHKDSLGGRDVKEFGQAGGTIGRALDSDWTLPDGQRYVSSRHASIDFRSGSYYIVDTSTNGVYVNEADQPVGRGKPQRLFSGDRIRIGEYEMSVDIDDETHSHLIDEDHIDPVDIAQRVEAPEPTGNDMVDAFEITGVGIEMLLTEDEAESLTPPSKRAGFIELKLEDELRPESLAKTMPEIVRRDPQSRARDSAGVSRAAAASTQRSTPATVTPLTAAPTPAHPAAKAAASPAVKAVASPAAKAATSAAAPVPAASTSAVPDAVKEAAIKAPAARPALRPATSVPAPPAPPSISPTASAEVASVSAGKASKALEPFFRGAGIKSQRVDQQQADAMLLCLGQLMRETIVGLSENLHLRAEQKNALRLPNTTIQPQNNNPLKFSAGVGETVVNLLFRDSEEYLLPVEALREAFSDIKQHQQTLLKALRAALDGFVGRLDPDDLEQKFSRGKSGMLMSAANKLKYWDLYKDLYQVVANHPPGEMPMQFLDDFAHAYEEEITRAAHAQTVGKAQAESN